MAGKKVGTLKRWTPKKWRPEYDRMVAYSAVGKSNKWIGDTLGFTEQHVSSILNQPQAVELLEKLQSRLRERIEVNIPALLNEVAAKSAERIRDMINNDELFEKSPFAVVDRGLDILKGLKHLSTSTAQQAQGPTINIGTAIIAPHHKSDIMEGLERVREIKLLHTGDGTGTPEGEE